MSDLYYVKEYLTSLDKVVAIDPTDVVVPMSLLNIQGQTCGWQ